MLVRLRIVLLLVDLTLLMQQVGETVRPLKRVIPMKENALGDGQLFIHKFTLLNLFIAALVHAFALIKVALKRYFVHLFTHFLEKGHFSSLFLGFFQPKVCGLLFVVE